MKKAFYLLLTSSLFLVNTIQAAVIYVKSGGSGSGTSWSDALGHLQDALSLASEGDEIWIAEGVYTPTNTGERHMSFVLKPHIRIYGGFAGMETSASQRDSSLTSHITILSGEIQDDGIDTNNSYNTVRVMDLSGPVFLNSLIIADSYYDTGEASYAFSSCGGINIRYSSVYLDNIEIRDNMAPIGGGICIMQSDVRARNIRILNNRSRYFGGGIYADYTNAEPSKRTYISIDNAIIEGNQSNISSVFGMGGGAFARGRSAGSVLDTFLLNNVKIKDNEASLYGGGIFMEGFISLFNKIEVTKNNVLHYFGGGIYFDSYVDATIHDMLVAGNTAVGFNGVGGGIYAWGDGIVRLINMTMADNEASYTANQLYGDMTMFLKNSIIDSFSNGKQDISKHDMPTPAAHVAFSNCLLGGHIPSYFIDEGGNIQGSSPMFLTGTYQLQESSLAIDAGNNLHRTVSYSDDLAGNPRISNSIVDIGAYEFIQGGQGPNSADDLEIENNIIEVYPNPAHDNLTIEVGNIPFSQGNMSIDIVDITGKPLCSFNPAYSNKQNKYAIDLSFLPAGNFNLIISIDSPQEGTQYSTVRKITKL